MQLAHLTLGERGQFAVGGDVERPAEFGGVRRVEGRVERRVIANRLRDRQVRIQVRPLRHVSRLRENGRHCAWHAAAEHPVRLRAPIDPSAYVALGRVADTTAGTGFDADDRLKFVACLRILLERVDRGAQDLGAVSPVCRGVVLVAGHAETAHSQVRRLRTRKLNDADAVAQVRLDCDQVGA